MEKRRKKSPGKQKRGKDNPININRQKALTIVGAFCAYHEQANNLPNRAVLSFTEDISSLQNMLYGLSGKVKREIYTGITEKYPSGILHQIRNTEGWHHNVQFAGIVLVRR